MALDESILILTNDLAIQLGISRLSFSSIVWDTGIVQKTRGRMATYQPTVFIPIPTDGALFRKHTIYLAQNMQGHLSPEEWKPLIAAALIKYRGLNARKLVRALSLAIPVVALYVAGWFFLPPLFPTTTSCANGRCAVNNLAWDILILGGPILAIGLIIAGTVSMRKFKWVADDKTAAMFGKDQLIASLRRASEVSGSDAWSIQQRIDRLS